jgi:hypothetical protein
MNDSQSNFRQTHGSSFMGGIGMRGPVDRSMSRGSRDSKQPMDKVMRESTISFFNEVFGGSKRDNN